MTNQHLPINLAVMGVEQKGKIDLDTIWLTPYPVITTFKKVCEATELDFLGGFGRMIRKPGKAPVFIQGGHMNGYILSGYRSEIINGNAGSMHRYAMALDVEVHNIDKQVEVGREAIKQGFTRVGFYPNRLFMHLDMAPDNWIDRFAKKRFWVEIDGTKQSFDEIDQAIGFMIGS